MTMWYSVQVGSNYDNNNGSYDYNEAEKIAKQEAECHPNDEIRIVTCDDSDGFCFGEEIFQKKNVFPVLTSDDMDDLEMFYALERFYNAEDGAFERGVPDKRYVVISHRNRKSKEYDVYFTYDEIPDEEYLKAHIQNIAEQVAEAMGYSNPEYIETIYEFFVKDFVIIDSNCFRN